jgi:homoserine acetyltransferase
VGLHDYEHWGPLNADRATVYLLHKARGNQESAGLRQESGDFVGWRKSTINNQPIDNA